MNVTVLNRLCCPLCKGELSLTPFLEESLEWLQHEPLPEASKSVGATVGERIIKEGVLLCSKCNMCR